MIPRAQIQTYKHVLETLKLTMQKRKDKEQILPTMSLAQYMEWLANKDAQEVKVKPVKMQRQ